MRSFIIGIIGICSNRCGKFVMIRQTEEGDTKGGIISPKDTFKEFAEFQKEWCGKNDLLVSYAK